MKSAVFLATLLASFLALVFSAEADSIGVNFATGRNAGEVDLLLPSEIVGVIAQGNWNNATGNAGGTANVTGPIPGALVNNLGAATTLTIGFTATNSWSTYGGSQTGHRQLLNGYLDNTNATTPTTISLGSIPYAQYDIYVYVGSDVNTRVGFVTLLGGATTYFATSTSPFDDSYTAATGTNTATANAAEYVRFSGLSGASQIVTVTRDTGNVGVHAVQVVQVPEPSTALLLFGACGLSALIRRRR